MEVDLHLNLTAALTAALAAFVLGGIWYGPLFGKPWQRFMGLSDEDLTSKGHPAVIMGLAFVLTLMQAILLSAVVPSGSDVKVAVVYALVIGVGFVATSFGVNYLFSRHPKALFGIDAGFNVLQFALMGAIIGAFG
ncbi:MAG: DUF1761 domain-containing protein [Halioglobus sp.]